MTNSARIAWNELKKQLHPPQQQSTPSGNAARNAWDELKKQLRTPTPTTPQAPTAPKTALQLAQEQEAVVKKAYDDYAANTRIPMVAGTGYAASLQWVEDQSSAEYQERERLKGEWQRAQKQTQSAAAQEKDEAAYRANTDTLNAMTPQAKQLVQSYAEWYNDPMRYLNTASTSRALLVMQQLREMGYTEEQVRSLADTWNRQENARFAQDLSQEAQRFGEEHPVLGSVASVPANLIGSATGAVSALDEALKHAGGRGAYETLDPNLPGYIPSQAAGNIRQTVAQDIEGSDDNSWIRRALGKAGSVVYQGTMSAADNLLRIAVGGGKGSLALAGMGSFQSTYRDVASRGGNTTQAMLMGLASAGVEALTEKIPMERLLNTPTPTGFTQLLKNAAIQGGIEVTEEEVSFLGNLLFDSLIMGDKSEYNLRVAELSKTMTRERAQKEALKELALEAAETAAVSFVSGGMMSAGKGGAELLSQNIQNRLQAQQQSADPQVDTNAAPAYTRGQNMTTDAEGGVDYGAGEMGRRGEPVQSGSGGGKERSATGIKRSSLYENTYSNALSASVRAIGETAERVFSDIAQYTPIKEQESVFNAVKRTYGEGTPETVYRDLMEREGWTGEDNDTAFITLDALRRSGKTEDFMNLARKQREQATRGGQFVQSFAKYTRTVTGAAVDAADTIAEMERFNVARRYAKGSKKDFQAWKQEVVDAVLDMANQIDSVPEGDTGGVRDIIRMLALFRRTTAWMGQASRLTAIAEKLVNDLDYKTAKEVAVAQLSQIPNDYRRRSTGEVAKTIRIHNMLSSLVTINRNIVGNTAIGMIDGLSDSTVGAALDHLVSLVTNRREVGVDVTHTKEFVNAATKAAQMAALCAELDIPMDTETKYANGRSRTFSPKGGAVSRFMSAYEKYLKYGLEVTDKFFEGGTVAAVESGLQKLGKTANLSQQDIRALSRQAGTRRTFKEERKLTRAAKGAKSALNEIGTENIGLGDLSIPFPGAGSNIAHTAIDYSTGGLGGLYEIFTLIKDAKEGKEISPGRQRKAVTDTARGITGMGLIALFTVLAAKGVILVSDEEDKDKRGLAQAEGFSGAQLNVSAALRALKGENTEPLQDDCLIGLDFMEPFSAQIRIGYLLAQEDDAQSIVSSYPKHAAASIASALLDSPFMSGLSEAADLTSSLIDAAFQEDTEALKDASGEMLGSVATSYIPAWMRQTAYMADPYYRDTSGDTPAEAAANRFMSQIPGLSYTLPKKYSGLGEEQRRYAKGEELQGFFSTFLLPGNVTSVAPSDISSFLEELANATGDMSIYPEYLAPKSFAVDGKNIVVSGKEMTEKYQKIYGENVSRLYGQLISHSGFDDLSAGNQVSALKKAKQYATDLAKAAVSDYSASWMIDKKAATATAIVQSLAKKEAQAYGLSEGVAQEAVSSGMSAESMAYIGSLVSALTPREGKSNVSTAQKLEAIVDAPNLSDKDEEAWLRLYMDAALETKYDTAKEMGVDTETFVDAYIIAQDNNRAKKATIQQLQEELGLTSEIAEALWRMYYGR